MSVVCLNNQYKFMGSDDFARVNSKLGFMFESYLRSKNLLVRLYSIVRNAQYIWENKLERGQTQFKNFENMLNGSRFLEATPMPISENSVIIGRLNLRTLRIC